MSERSERIEDTGLYSCARKRKATKNGDGA